MGLRLIRQTSETPNVTNKDDTIMTRYAYGGYNGVVKAFGSECGYTADNGIFKVLDGRIVIDGWEIDIDGAGWSLDLHSITGTQYHTIYSQINVATETVKIDSTYLVGSYPIIEKGDDLTSIPNGTARSLLYNVKVENGKISEVIQRFEIIPYLSQKVADIENSIKAIKDGTSIPLKAMIAEYASADTAKGTIEERLTRLGFKEGSVTFNVDATATQNTIKRQGNYVLLDFSLKYNGYQPYITSFSGKLPTVDKNGNPVSFIPKEEITLLGSHTYAVSGGIGRGGSATMTIKTNGDFEVKISTASTQAFSGSTSFANVGYEAQPITN